MRRFGVLGVIVMAALLPSSCGDDGDSSDEPPLPPSADEPVERKPRTLSRAEYPAMREFVVSDPDDAAELQPICEELDAAPDTPVIKASRNACDRVLSLYNELESLREEVEEECTPAQYEACADAIEPIRGWFFDVRRVYVAYSDDLADALANGPCLEALADKDELRQFDRFIAKYDEAMRELRQNNPEPFQELETEFDSDLDDPTPCRP